VTEAFEGVAERTRVDTELWSGPTSRPATPTQYDVSLEELKALAGASLAW
jgi:hypothetical protein